MKARFHYTLFLTYSVLDTYLDVDVETLAFAKTLWEKNFAPRQRAWFEVFDDKGRLVYKRDVDGSVERCYYALHDDTLMTISTRTPPDLPTIEVVVVPNGPVLLDAHVIETPSEKIARLEAEIDELDDEIDELDDEKASLANLADMRSQSIANLQEARRDDARALEAVQLERDALRIERNRWRDRAVAAEKNLETLRNATLASNRANEVRHENPLPWVVRHIYTKNVHSRHANIGPANITVARLNAEWGWNGARFEVVEAP